MRKNHLILLLFLTLPGVAFAAGVDVGGTTEIIREAFSAATEAVSKISGKLVDYGKNLTTILTLIALSWYGLQTVLSEGDVTSVMGGLIRKLLLAGIIFGVLNSWGTGTDMDLVKAVDGSFVMLAEEIAGQGALDLGSGLSVFLNAAMQVYDAVMGFSPSWWSPGQIAEWAAAALVLVGFNVLLIGAAAVYACSYALSQYMVVLAVLAGPVLIPWLLLGSVTSWLFSSWLRFLFTAGIAKFVGAVVLLIAQAMLQSIANFSTRMAEANKAAAAMSGADQIAALQGYIAPAIAATIVAAVVAFLMSKIFELANGLTSGSATGGDGAMSAVRSQVSSAAGAMRGMANGKSATSGAVSAARGAVAAARNIINPKK